MSHLIAVLLESAVNKIGRTHMWGIKQIPGWAAMNLRFPVSLIGAAAAFVSATCWTISARIEVPNNIDTIVQELQHVGYWNSVAATASCVAAIFTCLSLVLASR